MIEALGPKIRRQRRRLGLTLDELAGRTGISKPYLSLIETGRVPNPPSDEKLRRLEQTLGFTPSELVAQAHLQRTPRDVKAVLQQLMKKGSGFGVQGSGAKEEGAAAESGLRATGRSRQTSCLKPEPSSSLSLRAEGRTLNPPPSAPINLDDAYLTGVLQELVDQSAGNIDSVAANAVPVINRVSAGYPKDFTDLSYPRGVADGYISCPDLDDRDAFAARVSGDSMTPKYREGDIVIFSPALPPREGDDCFVRFQDGQTTFKRIFFESSEGKSLLRLQPRNERYRPQVVPSDNITGLYRAVYRYQRVDAAES